MRRSCFSAVFPPLIRRFSAGSPPEIRSLLHSRSRPDPQVFRGFLTRFAQVFRTYFSS